MLTIAIDFCNLSLGIFQSYLYLGKLLPLVSKILSWSSRNFDITFLPNDAVVFVSNQFLAGI